MSSQKVRWLKHLPCMYSLFLLLDSSEGTKRGKMTVSECSEEDKNRSFLHNPPLQEALTSEEEYLSLRQRAQTWWGGHPPEEQSAALPVAELPTDPAAPLASPLFSDSLL